MTLPQQLSRFTDFPLDTQRVKDYTVEPTWGRQALAFLGLDAVEVEGLGLDYSKWQIQVDAQKAKDNGASFAFIRAAYGLTPDTKFIQHWAIAKSKLLRGLYLYYLDAKDPFIQAQVVFDLCAGDLGEMPPVLDLEDYGNTQLTALKVQQCLGKLEDLFNKTPIIYTGKSVWDKWFGKDATWGLAYPLWLAQYTLVGWQENHLTKVLNYPPSIPQPFFEFDFWQFSASCPAGNYGVSGTVVDVNYAAPGVLEKYGNPPPIEPPPAIGDEVMIYYKSKNVMNIRDLPKLGGKKVGSLPAGVVFPALDIVVDTPSSVWVKLDKNQWVALVHAGITYLDNDHVENCPAGVPMTPEQLTRLEEAETFITQHEAEITILQNTSQPVMTHKINTTEPNGVKLDAYPAGGEAVMLPNLTQVRQLKMNTWKGQKLYAAFVGNVWVSGWLTDAEVLPL